MANRDFASASVIAIHGVGKHKDGFIQERLGATLACSSVHNQVKEFNWDELEDHSVTRASDGVKLLNQTAQSIVATASLPLLMPEGRVGRWLRRIEDALYARLFRVFVALGISGLLIAPLLYLLVLLPSLVFEVISWEQFRWVRTAALVFTGVGFVLVSILLGLGAVQSLLSLSLRPLLVTLRRILLMLVQPFVLLITVPLSATFGSSILNQVARFLPLFLIAGLVTVSLGMWAEEAGPAAKKAGFAFALLAAAACVGALQLWLRGRWIDGPLKVVLDIVRYMGDPPYRTRLQKALDEKIVDVAPEAGGGRRIVFFAHSLGSVIVLDSLVSSSVWSSSDRVDLVTLGCPIKRFFLRFFPGYLFPGSIRDSARLAASRIGRFRWINIHRTWDYVGTRLGLGRSRAGVDLSTAQWWKVCSAHSDYWGDCRVVAAFKRGVESAQPAPKAAPEASFEPQCAIPACVEASGNSWAGSRGLEWAVTGLLPLVLVFAVLHFVPVHRDWSTAIESDLAHLRVDGLGTTAVVTHHRTLEGSYPESFRVHHFRFEYPVEGRVEPVRLGPEPASNAAADVNARRFDYRALADFVRLDCEPLGERPRCWEFWTAQFWNRLAIPCRRDGIPLLYDPAEPKSFLLPTFPPRKTIGDRLGEVAGVLSGAFYFLLVCWALLVGGGIPLFRLFLGLPAFGSLDRSPLGTLR